MKQYTEQMIETLAAERTTTGLNLANIDGTYLRALVLGAQGKFTVKRGKRPATEAQLTAVESIATPFYAAVLRGVMTVDIVLTPELPAEEVTRRTRERNRRATFARSAKSTLVAWVTAGGDIRALNGAAVTKGQLQTEIAAARPERSTPERVEQAQTTILAAVAREGPEAGAALLDGVIAALQAARAELSGTTVVERGPVRFTGHMRTVNVQEGRRANRSAP